LKLISSHWETKRLYVRDVVLDTDLDDLQRLWESTAYIGQFDGRPERNADDMYKDLTAGDLPPGGTKEFFKLQSFFSKTTSEMIGFLTTYHGYPDDETIWVAFFCVNSNHQTKGFGQEVIKQFSTEAARAGIRKLMLTVALKDWGAIRFWSKAGFDKITGVYGDKVYGSNTFAHLGLEKSWE